MAPPTDKRGGGRGGRNFDHHLKKNAIHQSPLFKTPFHQSPKFMPNHHSPKKQNLNHHSPNLARLFTIYKFMVQFDTELTETVILKDEN